MRAWTAVPLLVAGCASYPDRAIGLRPESPLFETDSPRPTLRWEPLCVPGAEDVVYDVRVFDRHGSRESKEGFAVPGYTLQWEILPGEDYRWTVRARFTLDGRPRSTPWTDVPPYPSRGALSGVPPRGIPLRYVK